MSFIQEIGSVMLVWSPGLRRFRRVLLACLVNFDAWTGIFCESDIPTTLRTYGSGRWTDEDDVFWVEAEFESGGSLSHFAEKARLSPTQLHIVLYGTAHALAFMYARGLGHCGVESDNILIDEKLEPHLDGFFDECLGKRAAAPELDDDVWLFGMIVGRLRLEDATDCLPRLIRTTNFWISA
jgi:serine/threonine protein kinase